MLIRTKVSLAADLVCQAFPQRTVYLCSSYCFASQIGLILEAIAPFGRRTLHSS